jgi:hypothetical protein
MYVTVRIHHPDPFLYVDTLDRLNSELGTIFECHLDPGRFDIDSDPQIRTTEITGPEPAHFLSAFQDVNKKKFCSPKFFAFFITNHVHLQQSSKITKVPYLEITKL